MQLTITADELKSFGPCYTGEALDSLMKLARSRERWTALDILEQEQFPAADRLWLVLRERLIPAATLHELACRFAEAALLAERAADREPDPRSWRAIDTKRQWLRGEASLTQLAAAEAAAWAAAWAAARAAARAAAWAAARAAARAAAWAAAWAAARAAAWAAAWAAARAAARDAARDAAWASQVAIVRLVLQEQWSETC